MSTFVVKEAVTVAGPSDSLHQNNMRIEVAYGVAEACWLGYSLSERHQVWHARLEVWLQIGSNIVICLRVSFCSIIVVVRIVALVWLLVISVILVSTVNWSLNLSGVRPGIVSLHEPWRLNLGVWLLIIITLPFLELVNFFGVLWVQSKLIVFVHEKLRLSRLRRLSLCRELLIGLLLLVWVFVVLHWI